MAPLAVGSLKDSSVMAYESMYSGLLNAGQMNDASVNGRRVGGVLKSSGSTLDCVDVWTPMMMEVCPATESP